MISFDYCDIIKTYRKDKPCLDYLEQQAAYKGGWIKFNYEGCKALEIWIQPEFHYLRVKGSLPYFIAGQNFKTGIEDFKSGIDYLGSILEVNLYDAEIKSFENGALLNIPFHPRNVMQSHLKVKGMKTRTFDNGKYFEDNALRLKLYDAGKNLKQKLSKQERESLKASFGYNPLEQYLKVEIHYKKPETCFKQGTIYVSTLLDKGFQEVCKRDLLGKYNAIMKTKEVIVSNKKQLTCSTIPLLLLKEYENFLPGRLEDLISQKLKSFPSGILSKEDIKARKKQIKCNLQRLETSNLCKYDVKDLLEKELYKFEKLEVPQL